MAHGHRKTRLLPLLLVLALALAAAGSFLTRGADVPLRGGWQTGPEEYHPSRVVVRFTDGIRAQAATDAIDRLGYSLASIESFSPSAQFPGGVSIGIIRLPAGETPDRAVEKLNRTPGILRAEKDYKKYKDAAPVLPNDTRFPEMWGLHNDNLPAAYKDPRMSGSPVNDSDIDAPEAWAQFTGSTDVIVADIDTGCYIIHPDLAANIWVNTAELYGQPGVDDDGNGYIDDINGWDFFNNDNSVWDPGERDEYGYLNDEHGTHTSGTIGAMTNNSKGVAGINWNVKVIMLKFLGPDGGYTSDAIRAIRYAVDKGASVVNCSWGGGPYEQNFKDAIEASGLLFACAAGNSGTNTDVSPHYPSSYDSPNIISVAASNQADQPCVYPSWWSTCYGPVSVDLFAPGGYILSTVPPDPVPPTPTEAYDFYYGTSMATPHVTGVAALVCGKYPTMPLYPGAPGWTPGGLTVKDLILNTVDVKPAFQGKVLTGGRLNAAAALSAGGAPVITSATATPSFGPPPLDVAFTASATTPAGVITDKWWDFGDGSPTVHEYNAQHTYTELLDYNASFHVVNDLGIESVATIVIRVFFPPVIGVEPTTIESRLRWEETETKHVAISNTGDGVLNYTVGLRLLGMLSQSGSAVEPRGAGGPDSFGYLWYDSDQAGGPQFDWIDIKSIGTPLSLSDDSGQAVPLPFEFPFYGQKKTQIGICSNGYLTFGSALAKYNNTAIPDPADPNDLLAVFWDDLNPSTSGKVYYWGDESMFIVQWQDVPRLSSGGPYTFQAILTPGGMIKYQYKTMLGTRLNEATIGIENSTGTVGLQVVRDAAYVHDNHAVMFVPSWIDVSPVQGTVAPHSSTDLDLTFKASQLPQGAYGADVIVRSNDPVTPEAVVSTRLYVKSVIPPVIVSLAADPWAGKAPLAAHFTAVARDRDGQIVGIVWDFGDGSAPVSGTLSPTHTYTVDGEYDATLTVTDDDGLTATASVHIVVRPLPKAIANPPELREAVRAHRMHTETITVTNTGEADLVLTAAASTSSVPELEPEPMPPNEIWEPKGKDDIDPRQGGIVKHGSGGPDVFGYLWRDSDAANGPVFDWFEISAIGAKMTGLTDDEYVEVPLPFAFPFYGQTKTTAKVNANGFITFGTSASGSYSNTPLPNTAQPNDLMAIWWDDLRAYAAPADGGVFNYYDSANNRFIVEFKKVPRYLNSGSYTFQAILYPDGTIVYQYLDMVFSGTYEKDATIGIENATGTDGLQVLYNALGYIKNNLAIRFRPFSWVGVSPDSATIAPGESRDFDVTVDLTPVRSGKLDGAIVFDTNDVRKPRTVVPVHVDVIPNMPPVITACGVNPSLAPVGTQFQFVAAANDPDGAIADKYWTFGDNTPAVHEFVTQHAYAAEGTYTATFTAIDNDGYQVTASVKVQVQSPPKASWSPSQFRFSVAQGQKTTGVLTLRNTGAGKLVFGSDKPASILAEGTASPDRIVDYSAKNTMGFSAPNANPMRSPWLPDAVGTVIKTWRSPSPITLTWGVGVNHINGNVVIGDADQVKDFVVTPDGAYTGKSWAATFTSNWQADMAFDGKYIWQVAVGGTNAIYKLDPETGEVKGSISNSTWGGVSQRGLAYDSNDDTFFIGGWNSKIIYKIKGETWDRPGEVLEQWPMPVAIAGLAYHPLANVLVVTDNASPDMVYFVNPTSHATVAQFPHPGGVEFTGAGCEFDANGNLWLASQATNAMYLVETGLGPISAKWLSWEPKSGNVPADGSATLTVTVNAELLTPGRKDGAVILYTNDIEYPMIMVPVAAQVTAAPVITEATASPILGEPPLEVTFHAQYTAPEIPVVSYGWDFGDGTQSAALDAVHTYAAAGVYKAVFKVVDAMGGKAQKEITITVKQLPHATVQPTEIELTLAPNATASKTITIGNVDGHAPLTYVIKAKSGSAPLVAMPERIGSIMDPDALTAKGLSRPIDPLLVAKIAGAVKPGGVGDVIASWTTPSQIALPWGVGVEGDLLWISDPEVKKDHKVTVAGAHTGTIFNTTWAGSWPGDFAYDENRNLMWQVNVGGDNGIYGLDPTTGAVVQKITGSAWTSVSQRGVAYNPEDDTFYIGGWNENVIYHVKGPSWDVPGAAFEAWTFNVDIAGLAWHPSGILWVTNNGSPDMIYGLDLAALAVVAQFPHPAHAEFSGAGCEIDPNGNLWVSSMTDMRMYLVDTGMPVSRGITVSPASGTIPAGQSKDITIDLNASGLGRPGDDVLKYLEILTNDPSNAAMFVNLTIHIEAGPTITDVTATPAIGEPPLHVVFDATVTPGAKPVTDVWWDFGDGSDPVHDAHAEHVYTSLGVYKASVHAVDENGVAVKAEITVTVKWLPVLNVDPQSFDEVILTGTEAQSTLTISNTGVAAMNFAVSTAPSFADSPEWKRYASTEHVKGDNASKPRGYAGAGAGGPDLFGYVWMDSKEHGGPSFDWFEISGVGTRVPLGDEEGATVALPFKFPFYGELKSQIGIASNGYLCFDQSALRGYWTNAPIPSTAKPNDMIAPFWTDLNPSSQGNIYYYHDAEHNRFIVEYSEVPMWGEASSFTFQVILKPDGAIIYQYLSMQGDVAYATVGIENATGADGLQVAYNAPYLEDGLAIGFSPAGSVLKVNPSSGYLVPGSKQDAVVTFGSPMAAPGTYSLYLYVTANDPYRPFAAIPVTIKLNQPPVVNITAPAAGSKWVGTQEIKWTVTDPDNPADALTIDIAWTRDGVEWHELAEGLANSGVFEWETWRVGAVGDTFQVRVTATDPHGAVTTGVSGVFTIINEPPVAAFSFAPSAPTMAETVRFTDESTDDTGLVAWLWKFGDGATSTERNPGHKYTAPGTYTVELTVTDNGANTGTVQHDIEAINVKPAAAFSFTPSPALVGKAVEFVDESIDDWGIVAWLWKFGDGSVSADQNPTHTYSAEGDYTVELTVIDRGDLAASVQHAVSVITVNVAPVAAFSFAPTAPTVVDTVQFTDESVDDKAVVSWLWKFGDDTTSTERNPKHKYAAKGKYAVELTVSDEEGLTSVIAHEVEVINSAPEVKILKPEKGAIWTGIRTIEYAATDADGDVLKIRFEYDYLGDELGWQSFAAEIPNTGKYEWDTSKLQKGGLYMVRVTAVDPDGASGTATSEQFTIAVISHGVVAAPNPAVDHVTFYYDIASDGILYVYDTAGRPVHSAEISKTASAYQWNLTSGGRPLANGLYLYLVVTSGGEKSEVGRLVISR